MVALVLFFILLLIVFSIPAVQTSIASRLTSSVNEKHDVNISLDRVSLTYLGRIKLNGIFIEDHHGDTLVDARELRTSVLSLTNLIDNRPRFGNTSLQGVNMKMRKYKNEEKDNLSLFIDKLRAEPTGDTVKFQLSVSEVQIQDSHYSYIDENADNPDILVLDSLSVYASDLRIDGENVSTSINSLKGREKRGFQIDDLNTQFSYSPTSMVMEDFILQTPGSHINADLDFEYGSGDFSDFVNKVEVNAEFRETSLSSTELEAFYDGFGKDQLLAFNTTLSGTLNNFHLDQLELQGMDRTSVLGDVRVKGAFPDEDKTFELTGHFVEFYTNYYDLINLLPGALENKLPDYLKDFGNLRMQGKAVVTGFSLDTDMLVSTQLGSAKADLIIRNFDNKNTATYKGNLVFKDFNIGGLLENSNLGKTSFNLDVDGRGFDKDNLNAQLRGEVSRLTYNNYTYQNIRLMGNLRHPVFNGQLVSNDPNLRMEFNGLADLSEEINNYDFEASVDFANLNELNFISRDSLSIFKGDVIMNMQGTSIDDAFGRILLINTTYQNQNELYYFDDFRITSSFEGNVRTIEINSPDVISGKLTGVFNLSEIPALFQNSLGSIYTNYQPKATADNQFMDYDFEIYNKIVEVFYPKITLAPETMIRGRVESDESEFRLSFRSPQIDAFGNMFEAVDLQVDNTNAIYNTYFEADSVSTDLYDFSEFSFINVTQRDTLYIRSEFRGGDNNQDVFNLNLFHTINEEKKSVVGIQRSDIKFKDNVWYLNESGNKSNKIVFDLDFREVLIDSLVMRHENERIRLRGIMRDSTYKDFSMEFDNVNIGKITPHIDNLLLGGRLDGRLDLLQEEGAYYPTTSLSVDSLNINNYALGTLQVDVEGNESLTNYAINAVLQKEDFESLRAEGDINVEGNEPNIDLNIDLDQLNLIAFSPLGGEVLNNIRGFASGNARLSGNYKNPEFSGELNLNKAGLKIPYLNVDLDIMEGAEVNLTRQQFNFNEVRIRDTKYNTRGILNGSISHRNFSEWFLNLGITTDRMLVLDTEADRDALYYGTAFISGDASITGPTEELLIDVNARTERGTIFRIPLSDTESVGDNSYIRFLSPEEKAARMAGEEIVLPDVKGLEMVFDLDVTNAAEVEVVVDQTSGSTLRGRGAGNLLLEINTNGKFNMWGDFVVYEGIYNFKYAGLVQKIFNVESGGSINWHGNPTQAVLDVSAVYEVNANPAVLLENPSINRNMPVEVVINLQGQLIQPDISFDIEFPTASSVVRSELEYRMDDRASKELQALFLVTQGAFYSEFGLRQNAITGTLAERASSLVNDIFADEEGKFQVGVNYMQGDRTPDQQTVDRFGVTLSTQITDRVLIDGQVGVPIGGVTETVIIGDVEISFLLNEDGSLRAKVFNRESNIQFFGEEIGFTQGVGLSYSVDFDTFKELIRRIAATQIEQSTPEEDQEEMKGSAVPAYINFPEEGTN